MSDEDLYRGPANADRYPSLKIRITQNGYVVNPAHTENVCWAFHDRNALFSWLVRHLDFPPEEKTRMAFQPPPPIPPDPDDGDDAA